MNGKQQYSLVMFRTDLDDDGRLRPKASIHIARRLAGGKTLSIVGCGRQSHVGYWFDIGKLDWYASSGLICPNCQAIYYERQDSNAHSRACLDSWHGDGPASNTGPTQSSYYELEEKIRGKKP